MNCNWEGEYKKLKENFDVRIGEYQTEVEGLARTIEKLTGETTDKRLKKIVRQKDKKIGELMNTVQKMENGTPYRSASACRNSLDLTNQNQAKKLKKGPG